MIKIATAECFTHGKIGLELHALAQNYEGKLKSNYIENLDKYGNYNYNNISVTCSLFIPTINAVKSILNVENPPQPDFLIKGIKVYDEDGDKKVSKIMAEAMMNLTDCDIAIGTTAGIGRGAICIITKDYEITALSDVYTDLRKNNSEEIFQRQISGIKKTIEIILLFLNNKIDKINTLNNVEITKIDIKP